ncbi:hypothetical protein F5X97DRAFT_325431 [Nemania serpens]|nr:hypothetical protein F5X97DRAFT_325431 [Nemania serpens]
MSEHRRSSLISQSLVGAKHFDAGSLDRGAMNKDRTHPCSKQEIQALRNDSELQPNPRYTSVFYTTISTMGIVIVVLPLRAREAVTTKMSPGSRFTRSAP